MTYIDAPANRAHDRLMLLQAAPSLDSWTWHGVAARVLHSLTSYLRGHHQWDANMSKPVAKFFVAQVSGLLLTLAVLFAGPAAGAPVYSVIDLGTLGGTGSSAFDINNNGQVTGLASLLGDSRSHAFRYTNGVGMIDLGAFGGASGFSEGRAINSRGSVAGLSYPTFTGPNPGNTTRAVRFTDGVGLIDLGTLGGRISVGQGINDSEQVVGYSYDADGALRAFVHADATGMVDIGTLGGANSLALDINNNGTITGTADTTAGNTQLRHAFKYSDGVGMTDLGTLGGYASGGCGINDLGQVTGFSFVDGEEFHKAFLYTDGIGMVNLGTLGGTYSTSCGINNEGHVVGQSSTVGASEFRAFLYRDGLISDLNDLIPEASGWILSEGTSINDVGQIVGYGYLAGFGTTPRAFLLNPNLDPPSVPEPGTLALLALSLAGLGYSRRKQ